MKNFYSEQDVIMYVYSEMDNESVESFKLEILKNPNLREYYNNVVAIKNSLDKIAFEPDPSTVEIILDESSSFSSLETSH